MLRLGRRWQPDWNDLNFPAKAVLPKTTDIEARYWYDEHWWGDQGDTDQCVGYDWVHWLEDGPVVHPRETPPVINPAYVYFEAQKVDEWPGEDYGGTSVRAGANVLQSLGYISEYRWALTADEVAMAVLEVGPVAFGSVWTLDMFYPDADGVIRPTGSAEGGHAYLLNGYDTRTGYFRIKNSWGRAWGDRGHAYIHIDDLELLLHADGEACLALEQPLPIVNPDPDVIIVIPEPDVTPEPIPAPEPAPEPVPPLDGSWLNRFINWVLSWIARIFG